MGLRNTNRYNIFLSHGEISLKLGTLWTLQPLGLSFLSYNTTLEHSHLKAQTLLYYQIKTTLASKYSKIRFSRTNVTFLSKYIRIFTDKLKLRCKQRFQIFNIYLPTPSSQSFLYLAPLNVNLLLLRNG